MKRLTHLLALLLFSASALAQYERRAEHDPNGIGKFYMGREIAHVMGHQGAEWLERPEREAEEKPDLLVESLGLKGGEVVADIGAGTGYFSWRLAKKVGPNGRVHAVEIQQEMLDLLQKNMKERKVTNVISTLGTITNIGIAPGELDLVLMVDVYHEFSHPQEMLSSIHTALKPSGRVVFVEYRKEDPNVPIKEVHKMSEAQVRKEAEANGFKWVKTFPGLPRQHLIIFEKVPRRPRDQTRRGGLGPHGRGAACSQLLQSRGCVVWFFPCFMDKDRVAEILLEIGVLLELKGENPFKTRAYANAARALETLNESLDDLVKGGRLGEIKGIGSALQEKITELVTNGSLAYYEELKASFPCGLLALLQLPGLGPKKVKALYEKLGVSSIEDLEKACRDSRVASLDGFGEKTQTNILEGIALRSKYASKHHLSSALAVAEPILESLRQHPHVVRCSLAGSVRRHKEVIGDIDFLASSRAPADVIEYFTQQPGVLSISAKGETKASVILDGGIQADLRVVSDKEFPFALAYFTGSKEHNIIMRQRAIQRGLRLNEYGLFRSSEETRDAALLVPCATEEEIYSTLDLSYVPPELREDQGEFEAAERGEIPRLIEWTELRGSLHNHTNWSDGKGSPEEVARFMERLGLAYWAITDHSKSSIQAYGLQPERLLQQIDEIRRVNKILENEGSDFRLLSGSEVDILADGKLDYDDELLARLDVVVASIHHGFSGNEAENTKRLVRAAENPYVHMLGHLTGRLLLAREGYKVNQKAVIDACAETGTWIELNATPNRFDMDWRLWKYAKSKGVKCAINCDAHRVEHAGFLRLGAGVARKGWLTRQDVINTLPLAQLRAALRQKREKLGVLS